MVLSFRGVLVSGLALAFLAASAASASAYVPPKHHYRLSAHRVVRHTGDIYVNKEVRSYLDPGPSPDYESDLYFEDTRYPHYLLGPGIFQRLDTSPGQFN